MAKFYAWSDLYYGGKTREVDRPGGGSVTVVEERFIVPRGDVVTQKQVNASDEEWDALIASGSVRAYPLPDGASESVSPTRAVLDKLNQGGELNQDMLLELAMAQPLPMNPPASEVPEGT